MDIDFSFWLAAATLVTAVMWLLERVVFTRLPARSWLSSIRGLNAYGSSFFLVLLLVLVLRSFLFEPFQIPSASMVPTLKSGDFILVNKFAYGLRLPVVKAKILDVGKPKRGEVAVFTPPHNPRYFIKRIVGLPGDRVSYRRGQLKINGDLIPSKLSAQESTSVPPVFVYQEFIDEVSHLIRIDSRRSSVEGEWIVPEGHYFVLGDNRHLSEDSRYWGFVSEGNLSGRALAIWMHKPPGWHLPTFSRNRRIR